MFKWMPKRLCDLIHLTFTTPFDFLELFIYNENKEAKKPKSVDIAKVKLLRGASFFYVYFGYFHGNGISSNNSFLSCLLMNFDFFCHIILPYSIFTEIAVSVLIFCLTTYLPLTYYDDKVRTPICSISSTNSVIGSKSLSDSALEEEVLLLLFLFRRFFAWQHNRR